MIILILEYLRVSYVFPQILERKLYRDVRNNNNVRIVLILEYLRVSYVFPQILERKLYRDVRNKKHMRRRTDFAIVYFERRNINFISI